MNRVLSIHAEDLDAVVQPGVTRKQLNEELRATGLFFPVDPGADATIGGMAATRASGTTAVRYGTMRENVLAMEAVMADGRIVRVGSRAKKSATGYDLAKLLIGSEGTLGIITELTVRLYGQPEAISAAVCAFETVEGAVNTVIAAIQLGLPMARIELLDEVQMRGMRGYFQNDEWAEKPTLFLEFHGSDAGVAEQTETFGEIASENGGQGFQWATKVEDRNRLWSARHNGYYAAKWLKPGAMGWATDVCVPISRLADCVMAAKEDLADSPLIAPIVGHVGDGNFHLSILLDPEDPAERSEAERLAHRLAERALEMDGTVSGEHGIGLGKKKYMAAEHGDAWSIMAQIKRALDPQNILNPGKIVDLN
jgi:D-lactate dehydrogenase (cytochrome)